ncbi:hypothetical protein Z517_09968 [Fonsecaea pedrosoi CBS 271.37]|uniref:Uncharacterized protein n=1 Tax=Fonsecaea pedrosoi CBS 271.37 TaxID=1442368 RepID=A0A0D2ETJ8_9EURO|nr:uncharacterized protein Z517_09968 [Fonsecaea pedrosoi CBS 271.37]KIW77522.1 hypothetical protein Z517_09968 [Fonsecaea pedrosoi CBS 271.37]
MPYKIPQPYLVPRKRKCEEVPIYEVSGGAKIVAHFTVDALNRHYRDKRVPLVPDVPYPIPKETGYVGVFQRWLHAEPLDLTKHVAWFWNALLYTGDEIRENCRKGDPAALRPQIEEFVQHADRVYQDIMTESACSPVRNYMRKMPLERAYPVYRQVILDMIPSPPPQPPPPSLSSAPLLLLDAQHDNCPASPVTPATPMTRRPQGLGKLRLYISVTVTILAVALKVLFVVAILCVISVYLVSVALYALGFHTIRSPLGLCVVILPLLWVSGRAR